MMHRQFTTLLAIAATFACRTQPMPPHLIDPGASPHPDYPQTRFICGLGIHSNAPDAITVAADKAKAAVASQVQSSIVSEFQRVESMATRSDQPSATAMTRSESTIAIESQFEHNELIRIVDSSTAPDAARALACLDRQEAAQMLEEEIAPQLRRHKTAVKRAQQARDAGDTQAFSSAYLEAVDAHRRARPGLVQARTILGGVPPEHAALDRDHTRLQQWAAAVRSETKLCVAGTRNEDTAAVEAVLPSLARLGLSATAANRCTAGCAAALTLAWNSGCPDKRSSFGLWVCKPSLSVEVTSCASDRTLASGTVQDKAMNGSGNRKDLAQRQTLDRLNSERLDAPLGRGLSSVLPIQ